MMCLNDRIDFKSAHREALIWKIYKFLAILNFQLNSKHSQALKCDPHFTGGGKDNKAQSLVFKSFQYFGVLSISIWSALQILTEHYVHCAFSVRIQYGK